MQDIERFLNRVVDGQPEPVPAQGGGASHAERPALPGPDSVDGGPKPNLLRGILRRWYIVLALFLVVGGGGLAGVWLLVEPGYVVAGYLRLALAEEDPLTGQMEKSGGSYAGGLETQAISVLSPQVIDRVADDLAGQGLTFFNRHYDLMARVCRKLGIPWSPREDEPAAILRGAVRSKMISAQAIRDTELVVVQMKSLDAEEAKRIVNAFMDNYRAIFASSGSQKTAETLRTLRSEKAKLLDSMAQTRGRIRTLSAQYGNAQLTVEQEMAAQRATTIFQRLSQLQAERINLEIELDVLAKGEEPNDATPVDVTQIDAYVNEDPTVQELTRSIIDLRRTLLVSRQSLKATNPRVRENENLLTEFETQLADRRTELEAKFREIVEQRRDDSRNARLASLRFRLDRLRTEEARLNTMLTQEDTEKRQVGAASMEIQDLQFQLSLDKDLFDQVSRRIKQIEMELGRDAPLKVHSRADVQTYEDKRIPLSFAAVFGGLGLGCMLAFLLDRRDKRLWAPEDLQQLVHRPLLGTVVEADQKRDPRVAENLIADFQSIRTNLSLLSADGTPNRFAVVSPGSRDGKTTFCINMATSLAGTGKRVLLIDGDLRRPHVMGALGIHRESRRSHKVVAEAGFDYAIYTVPSTGLDVLVPEIRCMADPFELISSPVLADRIYQMGTRYDHVIIDTPPVLAFPDALLLARIAGTAVLVTFCGRTQGPDTAEAVSRLEDAGVRVLGTVMNHVTSDQGYHRYGYGYYYRSNGDGNGNGAARAPLPAAVASDEDT